jgi:hypothetical protein
LFVVAILKGLEVEVILKNLIRSRRFWASIASIAVVVVQDRLPLTEEQITMMVMAVGAWIVGESLRSSDAVSKAE